MIDSLIKQSRQYDLDKGDYGPMAADQYGWGASGADTCIQVSYDTLFNDHEIDLWLNDWSMRQVCERMGVAVWPGRRKSVDPEYIKACPPNLRIPQLTHWADTLGRDSKQWFVRGYKNNCRAVLTNRYSVVDVTETLEWTKAALDSRENQRGYQIMSYTVTPDTLYLAIGQRNVNVGGNHTYAIGAFIATGEIGNRGLRACPFIQRHSCTNSIYVPDEEWSFEARHVGNVSILRRLFVSAIFRAFEGSVHMLDRLLDLEDTRDYESFEDTVDDLVARRGWTTEVRDHILIGSEGRENVWGLVQGISAAANRVDDEDLQADMRLVAGSYLA